MPLSPIQELRVVLNTHRSGLTKEVFFGFVKAEDESLLASRSSRAKSSMEGKAKKSYTSMIISFDHTAGSLCSRDQVAAARPYHKVPPGTESSVLKSGRGFNLDGTAAGWR